MVCQIGFHCIFIQFSFHYFSHSLSISMIWKISPIRDIPSLSYVTYLCPYVIWKEENMKKHFAINLDFSSSLASMEGRGQWFCDNNTKASIIKCVMKGRKTNSKVISAFKTLALKVHCFLHFNLENSSFLLDERRSYVNFNPGD